MSKPVRIDYYPGAYQSGEKFRCVVRTAVNGKLKGSKPGPRLWATAELAMIEGRAAAVGVAAKFRNAITADGAPLSIHVH